MKHQKTGRDIARYVLRRIREDAAYSNIALSAAFQHNPALSSHDKHLATELVYGVLRNKRFLEHALMRHIKKPLKESRQDLWDTMRLAAYQKLFLDRIPDYAAVNDAVHHAQHIRGKSVAGFVNAVLRNLTSDDLHRDCHLIQKND